MTCVLTFEMFTLYVFVNIIILDDKVYYQPIKGIKN